jgi:hypothetical protein
MSNVCFDDTRRKIVRWATLYKYELALKFGYVGDTGKHSVCYYTSDMTVGMNQIFKSLQRKRENFKIRIPKLKELGGRHTLRKSVSIPIC